MDIYPYGNADQSLAEDGSWSFNCQHGLPECALNLVHACIMKVYIYSQWKSMGKRGTLWGLGQILLRWGYLGLPENLGVVMFETDITWKARTYKKGIYSRGG